MKILMGVLFLTILVQHSSAGDNQNWSQFTYDQVREIHQLNQLKVKKNDIKRLQQSKKYLLNGEIKKAEQILKKISHSNKIVNLVKDRYLALIYFIDEDFDQSYQILKKSSFLYPSAYKETCQLNLLNEMILFPKKTIKEEFIKCSLATRSFSKNDLAWLNAMVQLHQQNFSSANNNFTSDFNDDTNDIIKTWMKIALYSNQEALIINKIKTLPENAFYSKSIREMAGLAYYRTGNYDLAMDFIEDISTANSEIIKGNISLLKQEYEIAFGHFKVALMKKTNSLNALERAIPLAWKLEQWDEGIKMLNKKIITKKNERNIVALNTAFKIRQDQFANAYKQLQTLEVLFSKKLPKEIYLMNSYVSAMLDNDNKLAISSAEACRKRDGLNCWIILHLDMWEHLGKTAQRKTRVTPEEKIDIESWKRPAKVVSLKEKELLNQSDIEELDNTLVTIDD